MTNNEHKYNSTITLQQETPEGAVLLNLTMNPSVSKHSNEVPICYQLTSSMYSAMQVNLIQEGIELARELDNPKYTVELTMSQDTYDGEVVTTLKLDPVDVQDEAPISYLLTSALLLQVLEEVGIVDGDGNLTVDDVNFIEPETKTVH